MKLRVLSYGEGERRLRELWKAEEECWRLLTSVGGRGSCGRFRRGWERLREVVEGC